MYDSAESRYRMIICRDLLKTLGLNLKSLKKIIERRYGPLERCSALISNLGMYNVKILNKYYATSEEYLTDSYVG